MRSMRGRPRSRMTPKTMSPPNDDSPWRVTSVAAVGAADVAALDVDLAQVVPGDRHRAGTGRRTRRRPPSARAGGPRGPRARRSRVSVRPSARAVLAGVGPGEAVDHRAHLAVVDGAGRRPRRRRRRRPPRPRGRPRPRRRAARRRARRGARVPRAAADPRPGDAAVGGATRASTRRATGGASDDITRVLAGAASPARRCARPRSPARRPPRPAPRGRGRPPTGSGRPGPWRARGR